VNLGGGRTPSLRPRHSRPDPERGAVAETSLPRPTPAESQWARCPGDPTTLGRRLLRPPRRAAHKVLTRASGKRWARNDKGRTEACAPKT